ncbi:AFR605Cp [Mucor ambiguus]|uniref:AFR605Cp n=1 Tax=Mucor ambiguus TaxID=91626 RepID=A0A0C9LZ47_9FUNG|nr:AFR605Cp [Mucor ambiguus]
MEDLMFTMFLLALWYTVADIGLIWQVVYYQQCVTVEIKCDEDEAIVLLNRKTSLTQRRVSLEKSTELSKVDTVTLERQSSVHDALLDDDEYHAAAAAASNADMIHDDGTTSHNDVSSSSSGRDVYTIQPKIKPIWVNLIGSSVMIALIAASCFGYMMTNTTIETIDDDETIQLVPQILGWLSAVLYIGSRVPQLIKNWRQQSTDGLSSGMFVCAVFGNFFFALSIFLRSKERRYIIKNMPWIIGSLATVIFDIMVSCSKITSIFAFGDSYTDNGSFSDFYQSNTDVVDPRSLRTATSPRIKRESDGPLWIEYLAGFMGDAYLYDFARSGATADNTLVLRSTEDMKAQVNRYLRSDAAKKPKKNSLFTMWIGVNDITVLFSKYPLDTPKRQGIINGIIAAIRYDMEKLYNAGAKNMLLLGLIPLENLPAYQKLSPETRRQLEKLVSEYNMKLIETLDHFKIDKPNVNASFFDTNTLFKQLFNSKQFESNALSHCNKKLDCGDRIWWDYLHPSTKTHAKLAKALYHYISSLDW